MKFTVQDILPQTIFLDLEQGFKSFKSSTFDAIGGAATFLKGQFSTEVDTIKLTNMLDNIFNGYNISFTTLKPTTGTFHTLYVGVDASSLNEKERSLMGYRPEMLGLSEENLFNKLSDAQGVIFNSQKFNNLFSSTNYELLAQVIAHETGHLVGLEHVFSASELMYPVANGNNTIIGGLSPKASIDSGTVVLAPGLQDTAVLLRCNLGQPGICPGESFNANVRLGFKLSSVVYGLKLVIAEKNGDSLPTVIDLGHIGDDFIKDVNVYINENTIAYLIGSSKLDGDYDIYSINSPDQISENILDQVYSPLVAGNNQGLHFKLYNTKSTQPLLIGSSNITITSVPLPTGFVLFPSALFLMFRTRRKR